MPKNRNRKRKKRRKKTSFFYRMIALVFIIFIIFICSFMIKRYGTAGKNYDKGMEAFKDGDYTGAVTYLTQAVNYDAGNTAYKIDLGMAMIKNVMYDEALQVFEEIKGRGNSSQKQMALRGIGITYLYQCNYSEAVEVLERALAYAGKKYSETDLDIAYYLADAQIRDEDPVGAVLTYTKVINQKKDAKAFMLRGMAYQKVGDSSSAEADLTKALEMSKGSFKLYMALYQAYIDQGKTHEADKLLQEAVELRAKSAEDYSNKGLLYMYMKEYEAAEENLNRAIEMEYAPAYFSKAQLYLNQGLYENAVESFNTYFEHVKDNALAYNQFGVCMMKLGRYEEALNIFSEGLQLNDRTIDQELMFNELTAMERNGNWEGAFEKAQAFVEKYPDDERGQKEFAFIKTRQK